MSNEEIFGIIDYLNSLSFSEFELETGDLKIRIKRDSLNTNHIVENTHSVTQETPPIETEEENNRPRSNRWSCILGVRDNYNHFIWIQRDIDPEKSFRLLVRGLCPVHDGNKHGEKQREGN